MKKAVIFGANNLGRGLLGQLFCESGYEVLFVDDDEGLVKALNERRSYTLRLVDNRGAEEVVVGPVRALGIEGDELCAREVAGASLVATAVALTDLPPVARVLAEGVALRRDRFVEEPLNVLVCENHRNAARALRGYLREHLTDAEGVYLDRRVGLVDALAVRMSKIISDGSPTDDHTLVLAEPYRMLLANRSAFVGDIPPVVGLEPCDDLDAHLSRELYLQEAGQIILAYLGYQRGLAYGYEALEDPRVRPLVERALGESSKALVAEHGFAQAELDKQLADLYDRLSNRQLGLTVLQMGRDPIRKLSAGGQLVRAARLAENHRIIPAGLAWGIAAGLFFADPSDPAAVDLQKWLNEKGCVAALSDVCGIRPGEPLGVIVADCYRRLRAGALTA